MMNDLKCLTTIIIMKSKNTEKVILIMFNQPRFSKIITSFCRVNIKE